jgi:hypothetical protein
VDQAVGGDPAPEHQHQGRADTQEDVPEVATLADLVEVRQQDGHDHAGLDPLTQEDHEGGDHPATHRRCGDLMELG